MSAIFAQPSKDENLTPGWNVQGDISATDGETGYAEPGVTATVVNEGQADAGYPNPPLAMDIDAEASGSYGESVITNGSYSVSLTGASTPAAPTQTGVTLTVNSTNFPAGSVLSGVGGTLLTGTIAATLPGSTTSITYDASTAPVAVPGGAKIVSITTAGTFLTGTL